MVAGLTGQTGAGKSTVGRFLQERGFAVIDCDQVARKVTPPGSECLRALADAFGEGIRAADGSLDRRALGALVFSDRAQLERLNRLIFPYILRELQARVDALEQAGQAIIVLDAPTLFESGADRLCRRVLAVTADRETRLARIMERDGLGREAALARMESQHDEAFFRSHADFLIENSGGQDGLQRQLLQAARYLEREAQSPAAEGRRPAHSSNASNA